MILLQILLVAVLGAQVTFYLIHKKHISTVRASSASTLIFALVSPLLGGAHLGSLQAAFFGATFVGMTDRSRLGWKRVLVASGIFALVFIFLIPFAKGFGGGLGAAAFLSSSIVYSIGHLFSKIAHRRSS